MRPHQSLLLDIGPLGLVEYLLKVDAFPVGAGKEELHHDDEVDGYGCSLQREEHLEVDPLVRNA